MDPQTEIVFRHLDRGRNTSGHYVFCCRLQDTAINCRKDPGDFTIPAMNRLPKPCTNIKPYVPAIIPVLLHKELSILCPDVSGS